MPPTPQYKYKNNNINSNSPVVHHHHHISNLSSHLVNSAALLFVKNFSFFHPNQPTAQPHLSYEKLIKLAHNLKLITLKPQELLYSQGSESKFIYFLIHGAVELNYKNNSSNRLFNAIDWDKLTLNNNKTKTNQSAVPYLIVPRITLKQFLAAEEEKEQKNHQAIQARTASADRKLKKFAEQNKADKAAKPIVVITRGHIIARIKQKIEAAKQAKELGTVSPAITSNNTQEIKNNLITTISAEQAMKDREKKAETEFFYYADPTIADKQSRNKYNLSSSAHPPLLLHASTLNNAVPLPLSSITAPSQSFEANLAKSPRSQSLHSPRNNSYKIIAARPDHSINYTELGLFSPYYSTYLRKYRVSSQRCFRLALPVLNGAKQPPLRITLSSTDPDAIFWLSSNHAAPSAAHHQYASSKLHFLQPMPPTQQGDKFYSEMLTLSAPDSNFYYLTAKFSRDTGFCVYCDALDTCSNADFAVAQLNAPAALGLLEFNDNSARFCSVRAVSGADLYSIERETLISVCKNTAIIRKFVDLGAIQLQQYRNLAAQKIALQHKYKLNGASKARYYLDPAVAQQKGFSSHSYPSEQRPHTAPVFNINNRGDSGNVANGSNYDSNFRIPAPPRAINTSQSHRIAPNKPAFPENAADILPISPRIRHIRGTSTSYAQFLRSSAGVSAPPSALSAAAAAFSPRGTSSALNFDVSELSSTLNNYGEKLEVSPLPLRNHLHNCEELKESSENHNLEKEEMLQFYRIKCPESRPTTSASLRSARSVQPPSIVPNHVAAFSRLDFTQIEEKQHATGPISLFRAVAMTPIERPRTSRLGLNATDTAEMPKMAQTTRPSSAKPMAKYSARERRIEKNVTNSSIGSASVKVGIERSPPVRAQQSKARKRSAIKRAAQEGANGAMIDQTEEAGCLQNNEDNLARSAAEAAEAIEDDRPATAPVVLDMIAALDNISTASEGNDMSGEEYSTDNELDQLMQERQPSSKTLTFLDPAAAAAAEEQSY
jgi:CRP-like cAMP-binding protein